MSEEPEEELEKRIHPFTVKDALYLHDKKIDNTQRLVNSFEDKFKVLLERINEGVSPTMRRIEAKQSEIEKQLVQVEAKLDVKFTEIQGEFKVMDGHFSDKFMEFDRLMIGLRDLQWKIIGAVVIGGTTALLSTWIYVQQIKTKINSIPTAIETRRR